MQLTRTPSKYRKHDYSLVLTKDELLGMSSGSNVHEQLALFDKFFRLIDGEIERLGKQQGS